MAEAPTRRTLRMVLGDVAADRDEGDDILEQLLADRSAIEAAAVAVVHLESSLLAMDAAPQGDV